MRGCLGVLVATWALAVGSAVPAGPAAPPGAERTAAEQEKSNPYAPEVQDLVFLSESPRRPVLIRLHIYVDGKPMKAVWAEFVREVFRYCDLDGNGVLSRAEAARVPPPRALVPPAPGGRPAGPPGGDATLAGASTGKTTFIDLAEYYRDSGLGYFHLGTVSTRTAMANALTDALFGHLDRNKDGKLSKEELSQAAATFMRLDLDDDDIIGAGEILPTYDPYSGGVGGQVYDPNQAEKNPNLFRFVAAKAGDDKNAEFLAHLLKVEYRGPEDRIRTAKLTREQIGLDAATFATLDRNRDEVLDGAELARFVERDPDIELTLRLGRREPGQRFLEAGRRKTPLDSAVHVTADGHVLIHLGNTQISFKVSDPDAAPPRYTKDYFKQVFATLDRDGNGYLENNELAGSPYRDFSTRMDADRDGKIFEKEFVNVLNDVAPLISLAHSNRISIVVADEGAGLFSLLDSNRDGYLGLRELREAPKLLGQLKKDDADALARGDVPRSFNLAARAGPPNYNRPGVNMLADGRMGPPPKPKSQVGPIWFRKMDRNGDGDLSPREWLGDLDEFQQLDADSDGLISVAEAEKAEADARKRSAQGN